MPTFGIESIEMKKQVFNFILPVLLLFVVIGLGSCKKNREVKAVVTVLHDTIEPVGTDTSGVYIYDTITGPVAGAEVRIWSDQVGSLIDTTITTNSTGQAEFTFDHVAILRLGIKFFSVDIDAGYLILEEGEVVEKSINLEDY